MDNLTDDDVEMACTASDRLQTINRRAVVDRGALALADKLQRAAVEIRRRRAAQITNVERVRVAVRKAAFDTLCAAGIDKECAPIAGDIADRVVAQLTEVSAATAESIASRVVTQLTAPPPATGEVVVASLLDHLPVASDLGHPSYREADVRALPGVEVVEFGGGELGLLAVATRPGPLWIEFALLAWCATESPGPGTPEVRHYTRVFDGQGAGGALRELRHTYWGDPANGGYLFYPSRRLVAEAMEVLGRWFD